MRSCLAVASLLLSSCSTFHETARSDFAQAVICPEEKIEITERDASPVRRSPPPELASEPERRAIWDKQEDERLEDEPVRSLYHARGCRQERTYTCWHPRRNHVLTTQCAERPGGAPPPVPVRNWTPIAAR